MKHLPYGGSTAHRTLACFGWRAQADAIPPLPESESAQLGTGLHAAMERILVEDMDPVMLLGQTLEGVTVTPDLLASKIRPAYDAWELLAKQFNVDLFDVEVPLQLADDVGGTTDVLARGETPELGPIAIVIDWKFGDGILVDPTENPQALTYAACAAADPSQADIFEGVQHVVLAIIQPTERDPETLKTWVCTVEHVRTFQRTLMKAVEQGRATTIDDHDALVPGPHCTFCPAEATCPARTGEKDLALRMDPDTLADLGAALELADRLESWIAAVRRRAHMQEERGDDVPGWKLVPKRATRVWANEKEVEAFVKRSRKVKHDETHVAKLLSPPQMEKLYKEKGLNFAPLKEHISAVSSGTTLVRDSDKRSAVPSASALAAAAARNA